MQTSPWVSHMSAPVHWLHVCNATYAVTRKYYLLSGSTFSSIERQSDHIIMHTHISPISRPSGWERTAAPSSCADASHARTCECSPNSQRYTPADAAAPGARDVGDVAGAHVVLDPNAYRDLTGLFLAHAYTDVKLMRPRMSPRLEPTGCGTMAALLQPTCFEVSKVWCPLLQPTCFKASHRLKGWPP